MIFFLSRRIKPVLSDYLVRLQLCLSFINVLFYVVSKAIYYVNWLAKVKSHLGYRKVTPCSPREHHPTKAKKGLSLLKTCSAACWEFGWVMNAGRLSGKQRWYDRMHSPLTKWVCLAATFDFLMADPEFLMVTLMEWNIFSSLITYTSQLAQQ